VDFTIGIQIRHKSLQNDVLHLTSIHVHVGQRWNLWLSDGTGFGEQGYMAQWWDSPPPTNAARVRLRPSTTCGLSPLLVPAPLQGFFSGYSGFPRSTKTNTPNPNPTRIEDLHKNQLNLPLKSYINVVYFSLQLLYWFGFESFKEFSAKIFSSPGAYELWLHLSQKLITLLSLGSGNTGETCYM